MKTADGLIELAKSIVAREGCASVSLFQRRLKIGFGQARSVLDALVESGVVADGNPLGLYHTALMKDECVVVHSSAEIHARLVHDLALYLIENPTKENIECVRMLTEPIPIGREALRACVRGVHLQQPQSYLLAVALAISALPIFLRVMPAQCVEHELRALCSSTEVHLKPPESSFEARLRGLFHAMRYLKRRSMQGLAPDSRAIDHFVHNSLVPLGRERSPAALYREHVVPCVLVQKKASQLLRIGVSETVVAEWIEPYIRIVMIDTVHASLLDGPMKLKISMPSGWDFRAGCIYARLHELNIDFVVPVDGPDCKCGKVPIL